MTKVVYNGCFGGFGVSEAALVRYASIKGLALYPQTDEKWRHTTYWTVPSDNPGRIRANKIQEDWQTSSDEDRRWANKFCDDNQLAPREFSRTDPVLVQVVEELGKSANGEFASLHVRDVPPGTRYRIDEYDGRESVMTQDEYDWKVA